MYLVLYNIATQYYIIHIQVYTYNVECSATFTVHYNIMSYVYKFASTLM